MQVMFCQVSVMKKEYQYKLSLSALYSTMFISGLFQEVARREVDIFKYIFF